MTAIIKVKVQRKATIRLKVLPLFPSNVIASPGIIITRTGTTYTFSLDPAALPSSNLQALADNTGTGIWTVTGVGTGHVRTITGTANEIALTNGDGVAANPIVSLPAALTFTGKTVTGGTFATPAAITGVLQFALRNASGFDTYIVAGGTNSANRTLTIDPGNASVALTFNGNVAFGGNFSTANNVAFSGAFGATFTVTGVTTVTFPTTGTLATLAGAEALTNKTINGLTITSSTGTLTIPAAVVLTGPAASGTAMTLGNAETVTGVKTFGSAGAVGRFKLAGTTSGSTIVDATAVASGTVTIPAVTDTLIGKATTDTLTNKTYDTAGTGNSFSINGVAVTANSGTGAVARVTSPTFVTPTLGAATATTYNGNTLTTGTFTLTGVAAKTLTFNNSITLAGTDATTITFQGTDTYVGRATTDTLTNKSISGATNTLSAIALSSHATQAAWTFVVNNTSGAAAPTAVDIASFTLKASPAATDLILLSDQAASGAIKRATVSSVASAGSVSSIAGNTGAFTLSNGITNSTNDIRLNIGQLPGTATNDNASAGNIGEYISASIAFGSAVSLVNNTAKTVTSISLTAGDWDVTGICSYALGAGTTVAEIDSDISIVNNTYDSTAGRFNNINYTAAGLAIQTQASVQVSGVRISLASTTTVYLIAFSTFGTSTSAAYGFISARRRR